MIKFQFFEKSSSLNCHFKNLGTLVVSILYYMRAYFNDQAFVYADELACRAMLASWTWVVGLYLFVLLCVVSWELNVSATLALSCLSRTPISKNVLCSKKRPTTNMPSTPKSNVSIVTLTPPPSSRSLFTGISSAPGLPAMMKWRVMSMRLMDTFWVTG